MKYIIEIDIPEESVARYREDFPQAKAVPDDQFRDKILDVVIIAMGEMCIRHGHVFDQPMRAPTLLNSYVIRRVAP